MTRQGRASSLFFAPYKFLCETLGYLKVPHLQTQEAEHRERAPTCMHTRLLSWLVDLEESSCEHWHHFLYRRTECTYVHI